MKIRVLGFVFAAACTFNIDAPIDVGGVNADVPVNGNIDPDEDSASTEETDDTEWSDTGEWDTGEEWEYLDEDGDGYSPDDYAPYTDCDDQNGDIHPSAEEYSDDQDNDCDGVVDEETSVSDSLQALADAFCPWQASCGWYGSEEECRNEFAYAIDEGWYSGVNDSLIQECLEGLTNGSTCEDGYYPEACSYAVY